MGLPVEFLPLPITVREVPEEVPPEVVEVVTRTFEIPCGEEFEPPVEPLGLAAALILVLEATENLPVDEVVEVVTRTFEIPCGEEFEPPVEPLELAPALDPVLGVLAVGDPVDLPVALASVLIAAPEPDSAAVDDTAGVATGILENPWREYVISPPESLLSAADVPIEPAEVITVAIKNETITSGFLLETDETNTMADGTGPT